MHCRELSILPKGPCCAYFRRLLANASAAYISYVGSLPRVAIQLREREGHLYSSVVTGTHYGTKTPPDLQLREITSIPLCCISPSTGMTPTNSDSCPFVKMKTGAFASEWNS
jgi:hypothetical protein